MVVWKQVGVVVCMTWASGCSGLITCEDGLCEVAHETELPPSQTKTPYVRSDTPIRMNVTRDVPNVAPPDSGPVVPDESDPDVNKATFLPPETVVCADDIWAGAPWRRYVTDRLEYNVLGGTAAERDLGTIVVQREAAYDVIRETLRVTQEPRIAFFFSPSRAAALAHNVGFGVAYPGSDRVEVVYSGAKQGYENVSYGHELTHVLAYYIDPSHTYRLDILSEGLAEFLDQSGRNLHASYAAQLTAQAETRTYVTDFEWSDLQGRNYGRAGSLVKALIDGLGMDTFLEIWRAAYVDWQSNCPSHPDYGCINTPQTLHAMLAGILEQVAGISWEEFRRFWSAEVWAHLQNVPASVPSEDLAQIQFLVSWIDEAINAQNIANYRAAMDGFYCDWADDASRVAVAERVIANYRDVTSTILSAYPVATRNFSSAVVQLARTERRGAVTIHTLWTEKFPEGWRVTWGTDWY